jgi:hypothetical protein
LAGRSVRFPVGLVAGLFGRRFSAAGFWWPVRTVADSFGEYFLSGRLAGFWVCWFSGAIFPSAFFPAASGGRFAGADLSVR